MPVDQIWVDPDFNCRGRFTPESVQSLATDIQNSGLNYPLLVQPWEKEPPYTHRLVAGFRRFAACRRLRMLKVPVMITEHDISEFEAHKLNLMENLERRDLNILQEAQGIVKLFPNGATAVQIGRELNKTARWAHRRLGLLDLPHDVQLMFASGRLVQGDLDVLLPLREDPEAAQTAAHMILDARLESPNAGRKARERLRRGRFVADSRRTKSQIGRMIGTMFSMGVKGLPTRVAAWCAGTVTTDDFMVDLKRYVKRFRPGQPKRRRRRESEKSTEKPSET
jgi:ParB/RepB/Spo0J family partition protein